MRSKHLMYVPFTGLGKFNGFRGNRWLRNRITVFKYYVIPSLKTQTNKNFIVWVSWRPEEKRNPHVQELEKWMKTTGLQFVFTYNGVCFYDDKYPPAEAYNRLANAIHGSVGELYDHIGEADTILMTIQPSDDCYASWAVDFIQKELKNNLAGGFQKGYICNYGTKEVSNYDPKTNPPFYTIKFAREQFTDPLKHLQYTAMKKDEDQYRAGTPLPSHEYPPNVFGDKYVRWNLRGFLVGCHGENISTYFDHPYKGIGYGEDNGFEVLSQFGVDTAPCLRFRLGWKRWILKKLPHKVRRKVRYWFTERLYDFLRS